MSSTAFAFSHPVRVYWEDTDAGGVVFYANYLKFFERARTEWLRTLGFGQQQMHKEQGLLFVVTGTEVRYLEPARLDDELTIGVTVDAVSRTTLTLLQAASRGANVLADSRITLACVAATSFRPRRLPSSILGALASTHRQK